MVSMVPYHTMCEGKAGEEEQASQPSPCRLHDSLKILKLEEEEKLRMDTRSEESLLKLYCRPSYYTY